MTNDNEIKKVKIIFAALLISFFYFYFRPLFLEKDFFPTDIWNIPADKNGFGADLKLTLAIIQSWIDSTTLEFHPANVYPPLVNIFFYPLLLFKFKNVYIFFTLLTIFLYSLVIHKVFSLNNNLITVIIFVLSFFSYPFQFELERGQFNVLAHFFIFFSLSIFYNKKNLDWIAILLFIIAVQYKFYPLVFCFLFYRNEEKILTYIIRVGGLIITNFTLLFSLGMQKGLYFFESAKYHQIHNTFRHELNHSLENYIYHLSNKLSKYSYLSSVENKTIYLFLLIFALLLFAFLFFKDIVVFLKNKNYLMPFCSNLIFLSFFLPTVSHDYKLSILIFPVIYFICFIKIENKKFALLLLLYCFFYFSTYFHFYCFKFLSRIYANNFFALFLMYAIQHYVYYIQFSKDKKCVA